VLKLMSIVAMMSLLTVSTHAQKGTAPTGFYPANFHGNTFTGSLQRDTTAVADADELTLIYTKGGHVERFVGRLESTCSMARKDGSKHTFKVTDLPNGTVLTVFYIPNAIKSKQGAPESSVFGVSFVEFNGKEIPKDERLSIPCSERDFHTFMPFSSVTPGAIVPN
jgi:hypothetical protein